MTGAYVQWENRKGKWSKRWLETRNGLVFLAKSDKVGSSCCGDGIAMWADAPVNLAGQGRDIPLSCLGLRCVHLQPNLQSSQAIRLRSEVS